ncbi:MAG: alpha/beta hydrolase, partial [Nitrospinota bacterium]
GDYREHFAVLHRLAVEKGMEAVFEHPEFRSLVPPRMLEEGGGQEYRRSFLRNTPQTYADTAEALFSMPDLSARLKNISVPTWVCYGADDPGPMAYADAYKKNIPDCTPCILQGSGHFPVWDNPEGLLREMFKFLDAHPVK